MRLPPPSITTEGTNEVITKNELDALREAAQRASQDSMDAQQAVASAEHTLHALRIKHQRAATEAQRTAQEYSQATQQWHVQQQRGAR
jgi:hypothetical protein